MSWVDVSLDYPVLLTERVTVRVDDAPEATHPVGGALVVDKGIFRYPGCDLVVTAAVRGWGAEWDVQPAFAARVWDLGIDAGMRWSPEPNARRVDGWWGTGMGLRAAVFTADWWESIVAPGVGLYTGFGVVVGKGDVRFQSSIRFDAMMRFDTWNGSVMASGRTVGWAFSPGSARVSVLAGAAFHG